MNRRKFIGEATRLSSSAIIAGSVPFHLGSIAFNDLPDMVVCRGSDRYNTTKRAINKAGGISRYVPDNSSVGLLVNSRFEFIGTLAHPDVTLAILDLVAGTNPREIVFLQLVDIEYWEWSDYQELFDDYSPLISQVSSNAFPSEFNEEDFQIVEEIPGAKYLSNAEVIKQLTEVDVFINVPLIKHHGTTLITGALKNMMGTTTRKTNVGFHLGSGEKNDPGYLGQCIADINLLRPPDLIVADATELIVNNGPGGPGDIIKPGAVLVSHDPVAIDTYGCRFLDLVPEDIHSIVCANDSGLGTMDLAALKIEEIRA